MFSIRYMTSKPLGNLTVPVLSSQPQSTAAASSSAGSSTDQSPQGRSTSLIFSIFNINFADSKTRTKTNSLYQNCIESMSSISNIFGNLNSDNSNFIQLSIIHLQEPPSPLLQASCQAFLPLKCRPHFPLPSHSE